MRRTALTLAMLAMLVGPAGASPVPDSSALAQVHAASREWNRFRITTGRSQFMATHLRLGPDGVVVQEPRRRPAVIVTGDATPGEARRIPWAEVERIDGMRSRVLQGAVLGAFVGGLAGFGSAAAFGGELHDAAGVAVLAIPAGAVLGGVLGALVGGTSRPHRLYPPLPPR